MTTIETGSPPDDEVRLSELQAKIEREGNLPRTERSEFIAIGARLVEGLFIAAAEGKE